MMYNLVLGLKGTAAESLFISHVYTAMQVAGHMLSASHTLRLLTPEHCASKAMAFPYIPVELAKQQSHPCHCIPFISAYHIRVCTHGACTILYGYIHYPLFMYTLIYLPLESDINALAE